MSFFYYCFTEHRAAVPHWVLLFSKKKKNYFIFRLHYSACGILVPQPGIKPMPPILGVQSLNHWTTREVPSITIHSTRHQVYTWIRQRGINILIVINVYNAALPKILQAVILIYIYVFLTHWFFICGCQGETLSQPRCHHLSKERNSLILERILR